MSSYSAADVIQLPRLQASGAMALGGQLISAAKPHKKTLSKSLAKALTSLDTQRMALSDAIRDQVAPEPEGGAGTVQLDRNLDACWSGLNDYFTAFTKLPGRPQAVEATSLQAAVLPGGLKFILLPYELEWSESETRLQRIEKNKLDARIVALGGGLFLESIKTAHAAYGKALGMTAPTAQGTTAPSIREPLDAFAAALRTYIVKVMGSVEDDEPETKELADKLLSPLAAWDIGPAQKASLPATTPNAPVVEVPAAAPKAKEPGT
jgi:hypothetical protein